MATILTKTPRQIVEDAILAAMVTKKISPNFVMAERTLDMLYRTVEGFIAREDEDGLYQMVAAFIVGYGAGWKDAEHPNKNFTKYSDYQSE